MSDIVLNAAKVQRLLEEKGLKKNWVIQYLGLKRSKGYDMLGDEGRLPKTTEVRNRALKKLAKLLGADVPDLLLQIEAREAS